MHNKDTATMKERNYLSILCGEVLIHGWLMGALVE